MILRSVILGVALLLLGVTFCVALVKPGVWPAAVILAFLVAAIAFENRRYRHNHGRPEKDMEPTNERFIDPETGATIRVWSNAAGDRRYVEE
jgi:hypothetical protein